MSHQETDGILLPGWNAPLSFLSSPLLFFSFLVPVLCLKETEKEAESKEKRCLPFELLSDASRDDLHVAWALAFLSACPALAGLSYKWGCSVGLRRAGRGRGREMQERCRGDARGMQGGCTGQEGVSGLPKQTHKHKKWP